MRQFGGKGICCDTTHGTTGYDFKLAPLLVSDELDEGIPAAHVFQIKRPSILWKYFSKK